MQCRDDNRCPVCRAPRRGMSVQQAAPPPDRNAPDPNGAPGGGLLFGRPNTGHIMFFPRVPPVSARSGDPLPQHMAEAMQDAVQQVTAHNLQSVLTSVLPAGLIDMLLDIPSNRIVDWHRSLPQPASSARRARPRRARPPSSGAPPPPPTPRSLAASSLELMRHEQGPVR
jgi:hypothetical protein